MLGYGKRFQTPESAGKYAQRFARGGRKRIDNWEQEAVSRLFAELGVQTVLDLPCGAGRFLPNLQQFCSDKLIGVDYSPFMIQEARTLCDQRGIHARLEIGCASQIPLPDLSVDAIFCNRLLHHLNPLERRQVLGEFRRVTRSVVVVSYFHPFRFGLLGKWLSGGRTRERSRIKQPELKEFLCEISLAGFSCEGQMRVGPFWSRQKFLILNKAVTHQISAPVLSPAPAQSQGFSELMATD